MNRRCDETHQLSIISLMTKVIYDIIALRRISSWSCHHAAFHLIFNKFMRFSLNIVYDIEHCCFNHLIHEFFFVLRPKSTHEKRFPNTHFKEVFSHKFLMATNRLLSDMAAQRVQTSNYLPINSLSQSRTDSKCHSRWHGASYLSYSIHKAYWYVEGNRIHLKHRGKFFASF